MQTNPCNEFENEIQRRLDDRLPLTTDAALLPHRLQCEDCRQLYDAYLQLEDIFWSAPDAVSTTQFEQRMQLGAESARGRRTRSVSWVVAALLVITLIPLFGIPADPGKNNVARPNELVTPNNGNAFESNAVAVSENAKISEEAQQQAQQLLATFEDLPVRIQDLEPYYWYTSTITGVSAITNSVNITVDLLRRRFNMPSQSSPVDPQSENGGLLVLGGRLA